MGEACGSAKQLEICMCHGKCWSLCDTLCDWPESAHKHTEGYMCVKQYSFRLNDWTNEGLTKGRTEAATDRKPHAYAHIAVGNTDQTRRLFAV